MGVRRENVEISMVFAVVKKITLHCQKMGVRLGTLANTGVSDFLTLLTLNFNFLYVFI